jgi:predicted dithiol-disulfide oxidoreductase (DUF899 family)
MPEHAVGTREEWLSARKELLDAEKEHSRRGDAIARRRQELPWVPIEKEYTFETDEGRKTLADLFDGRSQLIVYHFMFGVGSALTSRTRAVPVARSSQTTSTASSPTSTVMT